jgi:hypothetical protein
MKLALLLLAFTTGYTKPILAQYATHHPFECWVAQAQLRKLPNYNFCQTTLFNSFLLPQLCLSFLKNWKSVLLPL